MLCMQFAGIVSFDTHLVKVFVCPISWFDETHLLIDHLGAISHCVLVLRYRGQPAVAARLDELRHALAQLYHCYADPRAEIKGFRYC